MEQIVFPVPNICEFLTRESKSRVFNTTERDEQGSKVNDFFQQTEDLYNEMKWQKKIRSKYCNFEKFLNYVKTSLLSLQICSILVIRFSLFTLQQAKLLRT